MILRTNHGYIKHERFHNILRATAEHSTHGEQGWSPGMGHGYKANSLALRAQPSLFSFK